MSSRQSESWLVREQSSVPPYISETLVVYGTGKPGSTVMTLASGENGTASCEWSLFTVTHCARIDPSQSRDGAGSDCCCLKSAPQVCLCDVLLPGRHLRLPTAGKVRDKSSGLISAQPHPTQSVLTLKSIQLLQKQTFRFPTFQLHRTCQFATKSAFFSVKRMIRVRRIVSEHF